MDELNTTIRKNVRAALSEDLGHGDLTASLVSADAVARARVISREDGVLCGGPWFAEVFRQVDDGVVIDWLAQDGDRVSADTTLCQIHGVARSILTAERAALNFLQTLSGTATTANRYAAAIAGTGAKVLDTRKTLPGLRIAQKYAVRCGGCFNHRMGLYDAILIKENHIRSAGTIKAAVAAAADQGAQVPIEVEIESLSQLAEALDAGVDVVMLDNFDTNDMQEAVKINSVHARSAKLEASGNVSLETIRAYAETGVDYISVGSLTKHVRALDLSLQFSTETSAS
ncbi:MAG: carboxylating nicotinate-nucleotide diphosphorylase [Gammaproteobacteria bacterium]|nr:carboxylating nicotinate-nucleotide diphosphorylase [Gammaproteobacteria bacterium]MDH3767080.1 carboxylating nicotinate-nucleotide diphosphorylase [Gammaproteobacteria bacterium]